MPNTHTDSLDKRLEKMIASALADRQAKFARVRQMQAQSSFLDRFPRLWRNLAIGLSAAACLAVAFFVVKISVHNSSHPQFVMPEFETAYVRGGVDPCQSLDSFITQRNYDKALALADSLTLSLQSQIATLNLSSQLPLDSMLTPQLRMQLAEEAQYKLEVAQADLYEVTWRRINLLMALDSAKVARALLVNFRTAPGPYQAAADSLYYTIK